MKIRKKLDEYGRIDVSNDELDFNFYGGGKGGGAQTVYTPQPYAETVTPPPSPVTEAVTQDVASTPEEEAAKIKQANKLGAKSLQIPLTGSTTTTEASKAIGTV